MELPAWLLRFDPQTFFFVVWWTVVGATIGSFCNVVVWRLPRGMSLSRRGSHCPHCEHAIRSYDNIPILSYLLLRGRCRDCGVEISSRYPIVEAIYAGVFLLLALVEVAGKLANIPPASIPAAAGPSTAHIWSTLVVHSILMSILLCALLIERDENRVPSKLFKTLLIMVIAVPTCVLAMYLATNAFSPAAESNWLALAGRVIVGAGAAGFLGYLSLWFSRAALPTVWIWATLGLGVVFGWQAGSWLVVVAVMSMALGTWQRLIRPGRLFGVLFWISMIFLFGWPLVAGPLNWIGDTPVWYSYFYALAAVSVAATLMKSSNTSAFCEERHVMTDTESARDAIINSPSYRLAESDTDFLQRPDLRPVRVQLELLKPEIILSEHGIDSTVVVFGGTRIVEESDARNGLATAQAAAENSPQDPACLRAVARAEKVLEKSHFYAEAREFASLVSSACQGNELCDYVVVTGGGPGIMEAANRGAFETGAKSIGLNITLPQEQFPNSYITPDLCFQFHYFALRKMHFLLRAKALVVFPGGFGTLDELFDALTLRQTQRMQDIPIILYGSDYWNRVVDFNFLADEGVIADEHLDLVSFADNPQQAWEIISSFHAIVPNAGPDPVE